jgi:PAS domain S-box-containing protein
MGIVNYNQILILLSQCVLVAAMILSLFRIRSYLGIGALYAALGLFQYLQNFLASSFYVQIADSVLISPGSSVLFTVSLFAILLVYIKEDALETRKIIYALLMINIIMSVLLVAFGLHFRLTDISDPHNLSTPFLDQDAWVIFMGTLVFLIDSLLIIVLFELISKRVSSLFLRIYLTMALVLSFDAICFSLGAFWDLENLGTILISSLIGKNGAVIIYSFMFYLYLKYFEKEKGFSDQVSFKDVFSTLSYRQKFEIILKEKENVKKEAENEIHKSQIKYQALANMSPVGVFFTNAEGYTLYTNPQWSIISGIPESDGLGWGWLNAVHPEDKEKIKSGWILTTKTNNISYAEYRFVHYDGSIRWVLGQAVPEYDSEKNVIGYVGTITDITNIKNYEKELNIAKEKAEESDRLKTAFLQNISHEIRTPLNAICGFASFFSESGLTFEQQHEYASIIQNSGNQLLAIVTNILTISSLETKQEILVAEEVCLNKVLVELSTIFSNQIKEKDLSMRTHLPFTDDQSIVYTDKTKVAQVLTNLITNAIKFTEQGFVEFGYNLVNRELEFFVKDTGLGISPELHEKIFERFRQADKSIQQKYGGTGLGLSISKGFVELLGGKMRVESEPYKGSTFYFTIPFTPVNETVDI